MRLAIIPARGGSKRIPRKNIRDFHGKPMIAHSIEVAIESSLFDRVIVSTDDAEVAEVARSFGAEVPFERPAKLADDHTPTVPVIAHSIEACEKLGWKLDSVCCVYATSPFIRREDLSGAMQLLEATRADYAFPVALFPAPIQRALERDDDGVVRPMQPEHELSRTQDLKPAYYDAGQFYWGKKEAWLAHKNIHSNGAGYVIPYWRVADLDTPDDWERAMLLFNSIKRKHDE